LACAIGIATRSTRGAIIATASATRTLRIAQGQAREGVSDLLSCGQRLEALGLRWPLEWKARAVLGLVSLGEHQQAEALAGELVPVARRMGAPGAVGMSLRAAARVSDDGASVKLLEEAVWSLERSSAQLELAYAPADLGAALTRVGRRREGRDAARRAIELAGRCGAIVLAETARTELQVGPGRRARVELTGPDALTGAELRVCRQAAEGHTNREIAQALFVTEKRSNATSQAPTTSWASARGFSSPPRSGSRNEQE
jgi:hypothetical protein